MLCRRSLRLIVPELIVHDPVLVRKEMSDLQDLLDLPPARVIERVERFDRRVLGDEVIENLSGAERPPSHRFRPFSGGDGGLNV